MLFWTIWRISLIFFFLCALVLVTDGSHCCPCASVVQVTARLTSLYGPIEASWAKAPTALTMSLSLPANTLATIVIPAVAKPATTTVSARALL